MGFRPRGHAGRDHARPACCAIRRRVSSPQHLGLTFHRVPGYHLRPRRRRQRSGRARGGRLRRVGGARHASRSTRSTGGQAGASSRIENYVGFPNGISGDELASRAAIQAQRLGARLNAPCEVGGLRVEARLPRHRARRRQRDPVPRGDHRVRGALPTARRRRPRALRRRRRLLRGDRPRGADRAAAVR